MTEIAHLISVANAYKAALNLEDTTVSFRVFADSKKLEALRSGSDITVGRFNSALRWFADNWPTNAAWPDGVARPAPKPEQAA